MTCAGAYADANDFAARFCDGELREEDEASICRSLRLSATNIKAALHSQGACDCTFADWATDYLIELNCVVALVHFYCRCSWVTQAARQDSSLRAGWQSWADDQLNMLRTGELELCAGETGSKFPATGWANQGTTEFARVEIIANDIEANS